MDVDVGVGSECFSRGKTDAGNHHIAGLALRGGKTKALIVIEVGSLSTNICGGFTAIGGAVVGGVVPTGTVGGKAPVSVRIELRIESALNRSFGNAEVAIPTGIDPTEGDQIDAEAIVEDFIVVALRTDALGNTFPVSVDSAFATGDVIAAAASDGESSDGQGYQERSW